MINADIMAFKSVWNDQAMSMSHEGVKQSNSWLHKKKKSKPTHSNNSLRKTVKNVPSILQNTLPHMKYIMLDAERFQGFFT